MAWQAHCKARIGPRQGDFHRRAGRCDPLRPAGERDGRPELGSDNPARAPPDAWARAGDHKYAQEAVARAGDWSAIGCRPVDLAGTGPRQVHSSGAHDEIVIQPGQAATLPHGTDDDDVFNTYAELARKVDSRLNREDHPRLEDRIAI